MNLVKFKIKGYDEASNSLLVSFASDVTAKQDPEDYDACAFQPITMWPDISDVEEIKRRIAMAGMHHAQLQATKEQFSADANRVAQLKALVGQTHTFTVAELTVADNETPLATV
jgi:hypothetical protein